MSGSTRVRIRGGARPEEIAAVLAALRIGEPAGETSDEPVDAWRRQRQQALRRAKRR